MKKLLLGVLLLIALEAKSQATKPIDSFLGIKFGSSYTDVSAELKRQGGIVITESLEKQDLLAYSNIFLFNRKATVTFISFKTNQAYYATLGFKAEPGSTIIELSDKIVRDIEKVYGPALNKQKKFSPPYEEGDGQELEAIDSGKGEINTYWLSGNNYIQVLAHKGEVLVMFVDPDLAK